MEKASQLNATVIKRINVTEELIIFHIKPDLGISDFSAGQYVALALPSDSPRPEGFPPEREPEAPGKLIKRAYSIGSSPLEKGYLEFYIAVVPDGALTSRLVMLKEGDRLHAAAKITGTFTLHSVADSENLVLVSTGTGIAPFMSMLRTPRTWKIDRKITVVHGVRYAKDLAYREELLELEKMSANFKYHSIVSRGDAEWSGERGHVQSLFDKGKINLDPLKDNVFLCGNPAMIDDMEKLLTGNGYVVNSKKTLGRLHLERYW